MFYLGPETPQRVQRDAKRRHATPALLPIPSPDILICMSTSSIERDSPAIGSLTDTRVSYNTNLYDHHFDITEATVLLPDRGA